ncbi:MAG TPA: serine hydrolase domain-containing protein [Candidatus Sulfotelmatobacter sp.]|nr:serine hydrolase domain-containing protein [Candidatus Sulfotelmatobacter sp.]
MHKLLSLLLFTVVCFAQTTPPDTAAGRQCTAWLQAFNRGDHDSLQQYLEKSFPARLKDLDRELSFRTMTGGFDLKKVEESSPAKLVALLQERSSDQVARLTCEVGSDEPHQISNLELAAIPRPADLPLQRLNQAELLAATRKKVEQDAAADRFAGAVLIAKGGKPIFAEAYGMADREHKIPNTLKTRFRIGSMNKMFTATATLQLAQAGKVQLTDPVGKYLTDYPNQDVASKVTIHQLLTHSGGTGDIFGPDFDAHRLELKTLQDYVKLYGKRAPQFEPGSKWEYSNYGFLLLGVVIEKVSGQSYYDYVRDHIYKPAGMEATASDPENQPVSGRSVGYTKMDSPAWRPNTDTLPYRGTSAGGGYSTVEDLLKFANALQQHKLLDAHFTELLTTGKTQTPMGNYAYGFADSTMNGMRCYGHGGGAPGMNGDLEICPDSGYVVAVLANLDPPAAQHVSEFITNRLPER